MKLCVDCKHFRDGTLSQWCESPQNGINPVTGKTNHNWAKVSRTRTDRCGLGGAWFEKSVPLIRTPNWFQQWIASKF